MKRLYALFPGALLLTVMLFAAPALAQYPPSPLPGGGDQGQGDPSGTAFTGANISLGVLIVGALLVLGVVALLLSRRKSHAR